MVEPQPGHPINPADEFRFVQCNRVPVTLIPVRGATHSRSAHAVKAQRDAAREALRACARYHQAPVDGWAQRPDGAPLPNQGWYWSISHKRRWAGAVIDRAPIGFDIEETAPRNVRLFERIACDEEWHLIGGRDWTHFFEVWTAKEATLKANGVGIGQLDDCRLNTVVTDRDPHWITAFSQQTWRIEHHFFNDHVAAVARPLGM